MSSVTELQRLIGDTLQAHQRTTGMAPANGWRCKCGYWAEEGTGGSVRYEPTWLNGAFDHQSLMIEKAVVERLTHILLEEAEIKKRLKNGT